jgi:peptidoglycan/LPS O-acetylase OafA/YrhL
MLNESTSTTRRYDFDWLRVLAVLLLIYFHAAAVFYKGELGEFYIQNDVLSPQMNAFVLFVHQWHMPLFFLLSGAASWFILQTQTAVQYVLERFKRLFVPFLFGTLILIPPQVYYHLLSISSDRPSYLQFYPQFFNGVRPEGNFEWGHLWFLIYLFTLSLLALPLFLYFKKSGQLWISKLATLVEKPGAIFLLALPLVLIEATLRPHWIGFQNLYNDWANFCLYLAYFIYGYLICADPRFELAIERNWKAIALLAIASMSVLFGLWQTDVLPERGYSLGYILYQMLRGFNSWLWVTALLGLGRKYLNFNNRVLRYLNPASYPIYVLHQTVLVAIAFYVVQWQTGVFEKFFLISTASLLMSILLYDLFVKRHNILRFLFGLKLTDRPSA